MFVVLLAGILQGVERPGSVYSIMPQWWHLMVLQYVAASFHLPPVSTANTNTVQHTKPYSNMKRQQSQLLWYPRCCYSIRQPFFIATADSSLTSPQAYQNTRLHFILIFGIYQILGKKIVMKWNNTSANFTIQENLWTRACKTLSFSLVSPRHWQG